MGLRWEILAGYGPLFMAGVWMTIQLTIVSIAGGLALGLVLGLVSSSREAPRPTSPLAAALIKPAQWWVRRAPHCSPSQL